MEVEIHVLVWVRLPEFGEEAADAQGEQRAAEQKMGGLVSMGPYLVWR